MFRMKAPRPDTTGVAIPGGREISVVDGVVEAFDNEVGHLVRLGFHALEHIGDDLRRLVERNDPAAKQVLQGANAPIEVKGPEQKPTVAEMVAAGYSGDALKQARDYVEPKAEETPADQAPEAKPEDAKQPDPAAEKPSEAAAPVTDKVEVTEKAEDKPTVAETATDAAAKPADAAAPAPGVTPFKSRKAADATQGGDIEKALS